MKPIISIIMLILLASVVSASWQNYGHFKQNNNRAYDGLSADVDNYTLVADVAGVVAAGTQPLIDDLDWDGNQEILVVRNNVMNVYDENGGWLAGISSTIFGNKQPAISDATIPATILVMGEFKEVYGFVFNGTDLVMTHNQTFDATIKNYERTPRCDVNNGVWDCYIAAEGSTASQARFIACDVNDASYSNFCTYLHNYTMTSNFNTLDHTLNPASNTQGGLINHYVLWDNAGLGRGFYEDTNDAWTIILGGSYDPVEGSLVLIKRPSATDYLSMNVANLHIDVYDMTFGAKAYVYRIQQGSRNRTNYTSDIYDVPSNPLNIKNNDVCGIFRPYYAAHPVSYTCPYTLICKNLAGVITRNVTLESSNDARCLESSALKVTLADINGDNFYEYFFNGNIAAYDFSIMYVDRTFTTSGWMIPVDLRTLGRADVVQTNFAGNLQIYQNGGGVGSPNITCSDTDNFTFPTVNWNTQGTVTYGGEPYTDYCAEDGSLTEFSCFNAITAQWNSHVCDVECQEGRCLTCLENWTCADWSACTNSSKLRVCVDSNVCGTTYHRPAVTEACNVMLPALDMPRNLVDVNNPTSFESDAFLPELWNGMMVLFSYTIVPIMILLVCIVLAALFLGLGQKMRGG